MDETTSESRKEEPLEDSPDYELIASPWIGLHYKCETVSGWVSGATPEGLRHTCRVKVGRSLNSLQHETQDSTSYAVGWKLPLFQTRGLQSGGAPAGNHINGNYDRTRRST